MSEVEQVVRSAYRAFNRRDIDAALKLMHPDVDWPNAWEGGRVKGHAAVRDYWTRQLEAISSRVEPESIRATDDGTLVADVHQMVHDARTGEFLSDSQVRHRFQFEDGLITRMDVIEQGDRGGPRRPQVWMPGGVRTEIHLTSAAT